MRSESHPAWGVRLGTLAAWALAAASVAYWGLRLSAPPPSLVVSPAAAEPAATDVQALARLLGGTAPQAAQTAPAASRFALVGVLAGQGGGSGAALIAVDGKPARPYRVGARVDEALVLQALDARTARLGPALEAPASVTLEMPLRR